VVCLYVLAFGEGLSLGFSTLLLLLLLLLLLFLEWKKGCRTDLIKFRRLASDCEANDWPDFPLVGESKTISRVAGWPPRVIKTKVHTRWSTIRSLGRASTF
jgi:hypothetical protein